MQWSIFIGMELIDNEYRSGGLSLTEIAEQYGTPLYVYDASLIKRQYESIRNTFSGADIRIKYACKANTNISILKYIRLLGAGLDAVSIQEVELGLRAGFPAQEILFTPNGVAYDEIRCAVELGVTINIDNLSVLELFGNDYGTSVPCCIRFNPHIQAGGNSHIQTGHIDSKFGISVYQLRHVERIVKSCSLRVEGLHIHTGSEILDSSVFLRMAELMFELAGSFPELKFIDFGSGFKVAYKEGDVTTDLDELGKELTTQFNAFCEKYGRPLQLWFEPGKYLVSESGVLLTRVNVVKQTLATVFAGVDSGQNHLIRPMFYDAYHNIVNISNPAGKQRIYSVVGYICETDTFGSDRRLSEVREGDILAICNAGAYGFSMSNNYNSRLKPAEIMIMNGEPHLIRQRETMQDILKNQVDIFA